MKVDWERISEFIRIFSAVTGLIVGAGFLFMGSTKPNFSLIVYGFLATMTGLISLIPLISEKDEYGEMEVAPKIAQKPV